MATKKKTEAARPGPVTAAFQGELGAFSHVAAVKLLGQRVKAVPFPSFRDVFGALKAGQVAHAVIPIENTLHGSILENYDHLLQFGFPISGETSVRIEHHLIAAPGATLRSIERAFSHPVALNQCRIFFQTHKNIEAVSYYDTAGSVKMLSETKPPATAAIASEQAAKYYGCRILLRNIEDNAHNYTRFFLLTKQKPRIVTSAGAWKTSVVFSTPNKPGALFKVLACLALRDLSLTKIESRPLVGRPWEYLFYVDFLGSVADKSVQNAIANLAEVTLFHRVLGSYRPTL